MIADAYFEIGSTHLICQDYALAGTFEDISYAIVADGCSSANFSEIGAQVLCHVAKYNLISLFKSGVMGQCDLTALSKLLANNIFRKADEIRKLYPIDPGALQATLLIVVAYEGKIQFFTYGDGVIIAKYLDSMGTPFLEIYDLEYPTNAPCYLSVDKEMYKKAYPDSELIINLGKWETGYQPLETVTRPSHEYFSGVISTADLVSVTVCSDGIRTFCKKDIAAPFALGPMVEQFVNYASRSETFVQRCMNFLKRRNLKDGIVHHDDISCATILL